MARMTVRERLEKCLPWESQTRAPRAHQVVVLLNEDGRFEATIQPWTTNTDRKIGRLRVAGAGRKGHRVEVYRKGDPHTRDNRILLHITSETYRTNKELAKNALKLLNEGPPPREE